MAFDKGDEVIKNVFNDFGIHTVHQLAHSGLKAEETGKMLIFIFALFDGVYFETKTLVILYFSLVQSHLVYGLLACSGV